MCKVALHPETEPGHKLCAQDGRIQKCRMAVRRQSLIIIGTELYSCNHFQYLRTYSSSLIFQDNEAHGYLGDSIGGSAYLVTVSAKRDISQRGSNSQRCEPSRQVPKHKQHVNRGEKVVKRGTDSLSDGFKGEGQGGHPA